MDKRCKTKNSHPDELGADWQGGQLYLGWGSKITICPFFFFKRSLEHTGTQPKICYWTKEHLMIRMMTKKTKDAPFWKLAKERWRVRPPLSNKQVPATDLSLGLVRDSVLSDDSRYSPTIEVRFFFPFYFLQSSLTSFCSLCVSSHLPL